MDSWTEEMETPLDRWVRINSECRDGIYYCDGYYDDDNTYETKCTLQVMHEKYGDPSPELRQYFKERIKKEFLKYWETI